MTYSELSRAILAFAREHAVDGVKMSTRGEVRAAPPTVGEGGLVWAAHEYVGTGFALFVPAEVARRESSEIQS